MLLLLAVLLAFYLGLRAVALATVPLTPTRRWRTGCGAHVQRGRRVHHGGVYGALYYHGAPLPNANSQSWPPPIHSPGWPIAQPARACRPRDGYPQQAGRPVAMILADIDHFKAINDRHGHGGSDRVITQAAALLAGSGRSQDVVARWGGRGVFDALARIPRWRKRCSWPNRSACRARRARK